MAVDAGGAQAGFARRTPAVSGEAEPGLAGRHAVHRSCRAISRRWHPGSACHLPAARRGEAPVRLFSREVSRDGHGGRARSGAAGDAMRALIALWFGLSQRVDRKTYVKSGLQLALLK